MIPNHLEDALTLKKGDSVSAVISVAEPQLTGKTPYLLTDDPIPLYRSGSPGDWELSRNPNHGEMCNVVFPIRDDSVRQVEVSYSLFSNYSKPRALSAA